MPRREVRKVNSNNIRYGNGPFSRRACPGTLPLDENPSRPWLSAVQIGTLIHRIDGGVSRPPVHSSGLARSCLIVMMWPIIRI